MVGAFPIPQAMDAEASVISALICDPACHAEVAGNLMPEHFYSDANRRIFEAILGLVDERKPVDIVAVAASLRASGRMEQVGGAAYLATLANETPAVANLVVHADMIREKWRARELIERCRRFAAQAPGADDVQGFIERAEREIGELAEATSQNDAAILRDVLAFAIAKLSASDQRGGAITGIPTGFQRLDAQCSGLHESDLYIVAARPGMGKTSFVINMALNVSSQDGAGVLFCSLEMPQEQLAMRILASEAGVPLTDLRKGKLYGDQWSRLTGAQARLSRLSLFIDDTAAISLHQLRAKIKRVKAALAADGRTLKLVVVDYLQLMGAGRNTRSREQEISEFTRGLKALAKEEKLPIVALSQLNRAVETRNHKDKRPQLSDLRESGAIEQDADAVFFLYRDEYYNKDSDAKGIAEIIIGKQRNGPTGTVLCSFTGEFTRFEDLLEHPYERELFDDQGGN